MGAPTPDDLDDLIARVWKEPGFFLAHPQAIAAFGRECTRRGVPPPTVTLFGSQFLTWRGLPLVPCDKIDVIKGKTSILLLRTGESRQGVVGLYQPGLGGRTRHGTFRAFHGHQSSSHRFLPDFPVLPLAVLTEDAVGMLENVDVGNIMSTSNRPDLGETLGVTPGYLPDIGELTRMVNEMFSTPPGMERVSVNPSSVSSSIPSGVSSGMGAGIPAGYSSEIPHGTPGSTATTPDPKSVMPSSAAPLGSYHTVPYSAGAAQALKIPALGADLPYADTFAAFSLPLPPELNAAPAFLPSGSVPGVSAASSAGMGALPIRSAGAPPFYFLDEAMPLAAVPARDKYRRLYRHTPRLTPTPCGATFQS